MSGRPGASAPPPNKSTPPTRLSSQPPCATHLMSWSGAAASLSLAPLLVWVLDARRFQGTLRRGCRGGGAGGGRARNRGRGPRATHLIGGPGDQYRTVFVPSSREWVGIIRQAPAGRPPSPSRPAGRSRPRGPEPLYTVRRDPDGHGALAAMGDARLLVTTALSGPGGDVPLRPDPTATTGGHASPRRPTSHSRTRRGYAVWLCADKVVTVHPRPACGRVGRAARAGARQGRDRPHGS